MKLVLLRHGESTWNLENRFTGWTDVDLSDKGIEESGKAAKLLTEGGYQFDVCFTSVLKRAIRTLWIVMDKMDLMWVPVHRSWRLNERHYGSLQGLNKSETAAKYGLEQVLQWRRSYDVPPPPLEKSDPRYPGNDDRYAELSETECPLTECLKDTVARVLPYWHKTIVPQITGGKGISELASMAATDTALAAASAAANIMPSRIIHTAQFFGPGIRENISIMPSPVQTV